MGNKSWREKVFYSQTKPLPAKMLDLSKALESKRIPKDMVYKDKLALLIDEIVRELK